MTPEARQRIVLVEAELADGTRQHGTGFRLMPGRILTSQHVIRYRGANGTLERARKLRVAVDSAGDGKIESAPAKELWIGDPQDRRKDHNSLDAALLADELSAARLGRFTALVQQPEESGRWETAGYISASENLEILRPDELTGRCAAIKEKEAFLDLTVDRETPIDHDGGKLEWWGVSGAPVFVLDGPHKGHLYGVVRLSPKEYPKTLYAVSMPALLRDESFRRLLGLDAAEERRGRIVSQLREILDKKSQLAEAVASIHPAWRAAHASKGVEGLLGTMEVEGDLPEVIKSLDQIGRHEGQKSEGGVYFRRVAGLVAALVGGRSIPVQIPEPGAGRLSIHATSHIYAELGIARYDERSPQYETVTGGLPRATLRMPLTQIEGGFGTQQQLADQAQELLDHYLLEILPRERWIHPDHLERAKALPPDSRRKQLLNRVMARLRALAERCGAPPYVVVDYVFQKRLGAQGEPFLKALEREFPALRQIELKGDPEFEPFEDEALEPLLRALGMISEMSEP